MGPAQSARGIQLGGTGTAARCREDPPRGPLPGCPAGPRRAHFLRGGAPRPALGRLGKARGEGGSRLRPRALQRPPARTSPLPGAAEPSARCALSPPPTGRDGAPCPRRDCRPGRTVLSAPQPRRAARAGSGPRNRRRQGSAAMSATHPTRLETRTKESNARASQRVRAKPRGAMKVRAGARRLRWDPGPSRGLRAHHRPVSPAPSGRWSVSARDRTRKMVNYAWAGRSQRKLWWRPAAVLTCKSVVRPGYRGERLIEPSSSWFPPKFPSG